MIADITLSTEELLYLTGIVTGITLFYVGALWYFFSRWDTNRVELIVDLKEQIVNLEKRITDLAESLEALRKAPPATPLAAVVPARTETNHEEKKP